MNKGAGAKVPSARPELSAATRLAIGKTTAGTVVHHIHSSQQHMTLHCNFASCTFYLARSVLNISRHTVEMRPAQRNTIDRLDKPSAYFNSKSNKRRRTDRDQRDGDDAGYEKPEEQEDPLKDATTLYVGNL